MVFFFVFYLQERLAAILLIFLSSFRKRTFIIKRNVFIQKKKEWYCSNNNDQRRMQFIWLSRTVTAFSREFIWNGFHFLNCVCFSAICGAKNVSIFAFLLSPHPPIKNYLLSLFYCILKKIFFFQSCTLKWRYYYTEKQ